MNFELRTTERAYLDFEMGIPRLEQRSFYL